MFSITSGTILSTHIICDTEGNQCLTKLGLNPKNGIRCIYIHIATNSLWRGHLYTKLKGFMCASSVNLGVKRWSGDYLRVVNGKKETPTQKQLPAYTGPIGKVERDLLAEVRWGLIS